MPVASCIGRMPTFGKPEILRRFAPQDDVICDILCSSPRILRSFVASYRDHAVCASGLREKERMLSDFTRVAQAISETTKKSVKERLLGEYLASLDDPSLERAAVFFSGSPFP